MSTQRDPETGLERWRLSCGLYAFFGYQPNSSGIFEERNIHVYLLLDPHSSRLQHQRGTETRNHFLEIEYPTICLLYDDNKLHSLGHHLLD